MSPPGFAPTPTSKGRRDHTRLSYYLILDFPLLGATDDELALGFNVNERTIDRWKRSHPAFLDALNRGRLEADAKIARAHYKRALGYEQPAVKIFQGTPKSGPVIVPYLEHYPGDVSAQKHWLSVRRRGAKMEWSERNEIEHKGLPNFAEMDAEARFRWATQLVERVQRVLASRPVIIDQEPEPEEEE
jgi:hypothetical protein